MTIKKHSVNYVTTDYSLFIPIKGNRVIDMKQVEKIATSMKNDGWIGDYIAVKAVKDKYQILRGQHRLAAAKIAVKPVIFTIIEHDKIEEDTLKDVIKEAGSAKNWSTWDFLTSWSTRGKKNYTILKTWMLEQNIDVVETALILLSCDNSSRSLQRFRDGDFIMPTDTIEAKERIIMVRDFYQYGTFCWNRNFVRVVNHLSRVPGYDHTRMIKKIAEKPSAFKKCSDVKSYIDILEDIYLRGLSNSKKIETCLRRIR